MIKRLLVIFCFIILLTGLVFAGGWGDVRNDNASNISNEAEEVIQNNDVSQQNYNHGDYGVAKTKYTDNFYIAVGVGTLTILLVLFILYLFIKGPRVKWKKSNALR